MISAVESDITRQRFVSKIIKNVATELVNNGKFNAGRLVALFSFCHLLNNVSKSRFNVSTVLGSFLASNLYEKVMQAGGYQQIFNQLIIS